MGSTCLDFSRFFSLVKNQTSTSCRAGDAVPDHHPIASWTTRSRLMRLGRRLVLFSLGLLFLWLLAVYWHAGSPPARESAPRVSHRLAKSFSEEKNSVSKNVAETTFLPSHRKFSTTGEMMATATALMTTKTGTKMGAEHLTTAKSAALSNVIWWDDWSWKQARELCSWPPRHSPTCCMPDANISGTFCCCKAGERERLILFNQMFFDYAIDDTARIELSTNSGDTWVPHEWSQPVPEAGTALFGRASVFAANVSELLYNASSGGYDFVDASAWVPVAAQFIVYLRPRPREQYCFSVKPSPHPQPFLVLPAQPGQALSTPVWQRHAMVCPGCMTDNKLDPKWKSSWERLAQKEDFVIPISQGYENYYHFLVEHLSKLILLRNLPPYPVRIDRLSLNLRGLIGEFLKGRSVLSNMKPLCATKGVIIPSNMECQRADVLRMRVFRDYVHEIMAFPSVEPRSDGKMRLVLVQRSKDRRIQNFNEVLAFFNSKSVAPRSRRNSRCFLIF